MLIRLLRIPSVITPRIYYAFSKIELSRLIVWQKSDQKGPNLKVASICFFIGDYVSLGSPDHFKPKAHLRFIWGKIVMTS